MDKILFNLALIDCNNFAKSQGIDISGTHLVKAGRGFTYNLVRNGDSLIVVSVTFHKDSVPTHQINPDYIKIKSRFATTPEQRRCKHAFTDESVNDCECGMQESCIFCGVGQHDVYPNDCPNSHDD